ncbi:MAG: hypothetical protein JKX76_06820 [Colwellia sp.]|nr:hypothetical protein [Colwellia sp.]
MSGELEKLRIEGYETEDYQDVPPPTVFKAYINPKEITLGYEIEYDDKQGAGTTNSRMEFSKVKPGDLSLTFFIDGTGANGTKIDVQEKIKELQLVTGYNGVIHRSNYLKVAWGTMQVKRCVLKSLSIAYKMFKPNGEPLRALVTVNFTDNSDDETRIALSRDKSPDLTHVRIVKASDTLPRMCSEIYGDSKYYIDIARINKISNFRKLETGKQLVFPPLAK